MSDYTIRVENISKQYFIGKKAEKIDSPSQQLWGLVKTPFQRLQRLRTTSLPEFSDNSFWALKDVSFDVNQGDVVGIIGHNGAGKSTLLKILTQITKPTAGKAEIFGRVGSLLEVGTGFHPELTGRENVYLNGTIIGMSRSEIDSQFDAIVDFAGVEQFIDTPVKRYSSGMRVRLAFSVAAHLRVDIMLIDEVLAVGDAEFQRKCLGKMENVASEGRTILFVSHNMATITALCTRAILLGHGKVLLDGTVDEAMSQYLHVAQSSRTSIVWENGYQETGVNELQLRQVQVLNHESKISDNLDARYPFTIEIEYQVIKPINRGRLTIQLTNSDGIIILHGYDVDNPEINLRRMPGRYLLSCQIPGNLLRPGTYYLRVGADDQNVKVLAFPEDRLAIQIIDTGSVGTHVDGRRLGIVQPQLEWSHQELLPT